MKSSQKLSVKDFQKQTQTFITKNTKQKCMHGYFTRTLKKDQQNDHNCSKSWTKNWKLTSHFEGYISAIKSKKFQQSFWWIKEQRMPGKKHPVTKNAVYVRQTLKT